ncbi:YhdP family protein [Pseudomaricurvus sp. HS19]|uniref:YhdP family protein n=1 Tax=Pseudomaricurvus sp. HS19 TaxID=2692626 RepID=UPI001368509C|nr:YhdP family protein [Pseudomaricurvus sp. HS19]MYM64941.1 TIGR02099 family protein [Pseudomaricurvus sp. HS19]
MVRQAAGWLARKFWGTLALLLIVAAVLVQLGREMAPSLTLHRDYLQDYFSERLSSRVELGALHARWEGLKPELLVRDFRLYNPAGQAVLSAERVELRLDVLSSVMSRRLRFAELRFGGLQAELQQDQEGRWGLPGIARAKPDNNEIADPLDMFLVGRDVELTGARIALTFADGSRRDFRANAVTLENDGDFHRFVASIGHEQQQSARLIFEGHGNPRQADEFRGRGYLRLQAFRTAGLMELAGPALPGRDYLGSGAVDAEVWLTIEPERAMGLSGRWAFTVPDAAAGVPAGTTGLPGKLASELSGTLTPDGDWRFDLRQLQIHWADGDMQPLDVSLSGGLQADTVQLAVPELDLGRLTRHLARVQSLPDVAHRLLAELGIAGVMKSLLVTLPVSRPADFRLQATLQKVGIASWKGVPQLTNVTGYLDTGLLSGAVTLDSEDGFLMHYPGIYEQPFQFDYASGRVAWKVDKEANQVLVNSGLLSMQGELGDAHGFFYLDVPFQPHTRPLELTLQIGLRDGDVANHKRLVPQVVPESLLGWLDAALQGGRVSSGGFVMNAMFGEGASHSRAVQLALNVVDGDLHYHPDWPAVTNAHGLVQVDDRWVHAAIDGGQLLGATVQRVEVDTRPSTAATGGTLLGIRGTLSGPAQTGLDILAVPPLRERIGEAMQTWRASGEIDASVTLQIPLSADEQQLQKQDVQVQLRDVDLSMEGPGLEFNRVRGDLRFDNRTGLSATSLTGRFWGQPVRAAISSQWQGDVQSTRVGFSGTLDPERLMRWSRRPELGFVSGLTDVQGSATIRAGEPLQLAFSSSLQGATVDLPAPFGKMPEDSRELTVAVPVDSDGFRINLVYDEILGLYYQHTGTEDRGDIALGHGAVAQLLGRANTPAADGLRVRGTVDWFDVPKWSAVLDRYQQYSSVGTGVAAKSGGSTGDLKVSLDVLLQTLHWGDVELSGVAISGGHDYDRWKINLDDETLRGSITLADSGEPMLLDLDYVRWTQPPSTSGPVEEGAAVRDSWLARVTAGLNPESVPPISFTVREISVDGQDFGAWKGDLRTDASGYYLSGIVGSARGLQVSGLGDSGALLGWQVGGNTAFSGLLSGSDLAEIAKAWRMPVTFDAAEGAAGIDLNWPGDPLQFSLPDSQGRMDFNIRKGRFFKTTGQASDAFLRLVGLFNFDNWVRRLQLDFSDVYKSGTPFDSVSGELQLERGMLNLSSPIEVTNSSSRLQMGGQVNLREETLDASLVATLPVGGNATLLTAMAAGLPAAAGVYLISKLFAKQVDRVASVSYRITGEWSDPEIRFDRLFDNRSAEKAAEASREQGNGSR